MTAEAAARFSDRVQRVVDEVLEEQRTLLRSISDDLGVLDETLAEFLKGGKRLRPAFCYWGWLGAGGNDSDLVAEQAVVQVAASLEFLQACALIHDDVMDGSETRRGRPAVHHRFANLHRGNQWLGSPEDFGVATAILAGDLCLSWADQTMLRAELRPDALQRAKRVYDELRTELMGGQYLDLLEQARGGGSIARASKVLRYKSAKYTIERPLHIGAALAGAPQPLFDVYSEYGLPLGEAFQLRDDVLGVFGDPKETGKPAGDDLREGKRTILVAMAFERASTAQQGAMREHLGDPALDHNGIATLRQIITETGALAETEALIESLFARALTALDSPLLEPRSAAALRELADVATHRKG